MPIDRCSGILLLSAWKNSSSIIRDGVQRRPWKVINPREPLLRSVRGDHKRTQTLRTHEMAGSTIMGKQLCRDALVGAL